MRFSHVVGAVLPAVALAANTTTEEGILSSGNVDLGTWAAAYAKATDLIAQMTNEEKVSVITGGSVSGAVNWTALEFKDGTQSVEGKLS